MSITKEILMEKAKPKKKKEETDPSKMSEEELSQYDDRHWWEAPKRSKK